MAIHRGEILKGGEGGMARVGIVTFLHNDNYGSSLQAYALQRVIRDLGHDCLHLDYQPDRKEKLLNLVRSGNRPGLILEGLRKKRVKAGQAGARRKSGSFSAFYQRRMKLSPRCRNRRELREASEDREILICGSDQIWNPVWLNEAYFLTFAPEGVRKASYAASLGISRLEDPRKAEKIRRWTADFQAVSVREEEGAAILAGITGRRPEVMPDPVCLLSREEWAEIASEAPSREPYLLCYFIGENPAYWEAARRLGRERGLPILVLPVTGESYGQGLAMLDGAGPEDFLGAIRNAALLCTDSFHGLAFATLFGTEVHLERRYRDGDPESKNSRVDHFLRALENRPLPAQREAGRRWLEKLLAEI